MSQGAAIFYMSQGAAACLASLKKHMNRLANKLAVETSGYGVGAWVCSQLCRIYEWLCGFVVSYVGFTSGCVGL